MKRCICFLVLALFLVGSMAYGAELKDQKYTIVNTTGTSKATTISTSIIQPNISRIIKVTVTSALPAGFTSTENVVGIYDCASVGATLNSALEGEVESASAATVEINYEGRPLKVYNGLSVVQGAYTVITVVFENHL